MPLRPSLADRRFSLLITGGSQGSRTLNQAARESWPLFREAGFPIRFVLQAGRRPPGTGAGEFADAGSRGSERFHRRYAGGVCGGRSGGLPRRRGRGGGSGGGGEAIASWCRSRTPPISISCAMPRRSSAPARRAWWSTGNGPAQKLFEMVRELAAVDRAPSAWERRRGGARGRARRGERRTFWKLDESPAEIYVDTAGEAETIQ